MKEKLIEVVKTVLEYLMALILGRIRKSGTQTIG